MFSFSIFSFNPDSMVGATRNSDVPFMPGYCSMTLVQTSLKGCFVKADSRNVNCWITPQKWWFPVTVIAITIFTFIFWISLLAKHPCWQSYEMAVQLLVMLKHLVILEEGFFWGVQRLEFQWTNSVLYESQGYINLAISLSNDIANKFLVVDGWLLILLLSFDVFKLKNVWGSTHAEFKIIFQAVARRDLHKYCEDQSEKEWRRIPCSCRTSSDNKTRPIVYLYIYCI